MPNSQRARDARMKLRHSAEMRDVIAFIFPKVFQILLDKAAITGAICTSGELVAASRYLAKALAEYDLRRRNRVRDARYTPLDEVYWQEDEALKNASSDDPLVQKIALARSLRSEFFQGSDHSQGGARHAMTNAIRHAWLICHDGCESINYRRKTTSAQEHYGPLHDFIESLNKLVKFPPNIDGLHREVQALDLQMHPNIAMP
jgi:hypothetical protein